MLKKLPHNTYGLSVCDHGKSPSGSYLPLPKAHGKCHQLYVHFSPSPFRSISLVKGLYLAAKLTAPSEWAGAVNIDYSLSLSLAPCQLGCWRERAGRDGWHTRGVPGLRLVGGLTKRTDGVGNNSGNKEQLATTNYWGKIRGRVDHLNKLRQKHIVRAWAEDNPSAHTHTQTQTDTPFTPIQSRCVYLTGCERRHSDSSFICLSRDSR